MTTAFPHLGKFAQFPASKPFSTDSAALYESLLFSQNLDKRKFCSGLN